MARLGAVSDPSVDAVPGSGGEGVARTPDLTADRLPDRAVDAPVDMASLAAAQDEKRRLLDAAAEAAAGLITGQATLPAGVGPEDTAALMRRFYAGEPAAEVIGHDPGELAALALDHLRLAARRRPGAPVADVHRRADGHAVLRVVVDDMPYLVDSVTAEVVRQGVAPDHVVHPIVVVRRGPDGELTAFCDSADAAACGVDALAESWMAVVLAGQVDDEAAADLVTSVTTVLADVRRSHEDAPHLIARAREVADALDREPAAPGADPARHP